MHQSASPANDSDDMEDIAQEMDATQQNALMLSLAEAASSDLSQDAEHIEDISKPVPGSAFDDEEEWQLYAIQMKICEELSSTTTPLRTAIKPLLRRWHPDKNDSRFATTVFQWLQSILVVGHVPSVVAKPHASTTSSASSTKESMMAAARYLDGCLRASRSNYWFIHSWYGWGLEFLQVDREHSFSKSQEMLVKVMKHRFGFNSCGIVPNATGPAASDKWMPDKNKRRWVSFQCETGGDSFMCGNCQTQIEDVGFHGTHAGVLKDALGNGMRGGWQGRPKGVYYMPAELAHLACGYKVYAHLFEDGWFWSVLLELRVCSSCRRSFGSNPATKQSIQPCETGEYCVSAHIHTVWMKGIHYNDFHKDKKSASNDGYSSCQVVNGTPWIDDLYN